MKLSVAGMAAACGLLWGGAMLISGICHLIWPSYGGAFLELAASIYPGYHPNGGLVSVLIGTGYGLLDAGFGGAAFAWLYNRFSS
jgi:hypothetical protein